jgi:hypothetical protein
MLEPKEENVGEGDWFSLGVANGDCSRFIGVPMGGKMNAVVVWDIVCVTLRRGKAANAWPSKP